MIAPAGAPLCSLQSLRRSRKSFNRIVVAARNRIAHQSRQFAPHETGQ
jgi:hypothetical protein